MNFFTSKLHFQFLLFVLSFSQQIRSIECEYFTAIVNLRSLITLEKEFSKFVDEYLEAEENRLQEIRLMTLEFSHNSFETDNLTSPLHNPINIFHLIRRMIIDFRKIYKKARITHFREMINKYSKDGQFFKFPDDKELKGVSVALGRLAYTYNLNISNIANGIISSELNPTYQLTAEECYEIGLNLCYESMFFKAVPWLLEFLVRENKVGENITEETLGALEFLGNATYLANDETLKKEVEGKLNYLDGGIIGTYFQVYKNTFDIIKNYIESNKIQYIDNSVDKFDPFYPSLQKFNQLCRGEHLLDSKLEAKLKCYYSTNKSPYLTLQPVKVEAVHINPPVVVLHNIITDNEIEDIKNISTPKLKRAEVGVGNISVADFRISESSWLEDYHYPVVKRISTRLQEMTGLDVLHSSEKLQVVNYGIGGFYDTHFDFDETMEKGTSTRNSPRGNRIATVLIYMSDVLAGGGTVFPKLNITVQPVKGSAAFWYNLQKTGDGDWGTEHGGCPVLAGSKWVSNKWIAEHHQEFRKQCGLTIEDIYFK